MAQKLILSSQMAQLKANAALVRQTGDGSDLKPVVKFFNPTGGGTWLISEIDEDGDRLFGLCDLGHGSPELGYVSLSELSQVRGRFGIGIERDMHFKAKKSIAEYADEARAAGYIKT